MPTLDFEVISERLEWRKPDARRRNSLTDVAQSCVVLVSMPTAGLRLFWSTTRLLALSVELSTLYASVSAERSSLDAFVPLERVRSQPLDARAVILATLDPLV